MGIAQNRPSKLEAQLTAATQEFVRQIVNILRNASFADVASYGGASAPRQTPQKSTISRASRPRQTGAHRTEMADRLVAVLARSPNPLGVRALSSELGVAPDALATPLRDLRAAGRVEKHGEKRNTTYSAC